MGLFAEHYPQAAPVFEQTTGNVMKNRVIRTFAFLTLFFFVSASAFAGDIVLTPFGQSPDAMMVKVVLKKLGQDARLEKVLEADGLQGEKVLITVVAGSSKGLGDALIVVEGGDYDGLFTKLAGEAGVELVAAPSVRETTEPLEQVLTGWDVL